MKKFFTLSAVCVLLMLSANRINAQTVIAQGTTGSLTWELTSDYVLTISGSGAMPDYYYSYSESPWDEYRTRIKSAVIGNSVTSIGSYAFQDCKSLASVTIPNSVTTIGEHAFAHCSSLTSVTIPNSVITIGTSAFYECSSLTSVTIPNSVMTIENHAFYKCSSLTSVTIPNSVTTIGNNAFCDCSSLTAIDVAAGNPNYSSHNGVLFNKDQTTLIQCPGGKSGAYIIPNSVTTIGNKAFTYCSSLTSVTIGNSVTTIGYNVFRGCSRLTSITIPNSVTTIGNRAFNSCSKLASVTIPNSVTSIENAAFSHCSSLTSVTIPNSVTTIGNHAFNSCSNLTSVTIPNSVTTIGEYAFCECSSLTAIDVAAGNPNYSSHNGVLFNKNQTTLIQCPGGKSGAYIIPSSVTTIGTSAFYNCSKLASVTIGNSVMTIGNYAFYNCSSVTSITVHVAIPPSCGKDAFLNVSKNIPVYVPYGSLANYKKSDWWGGYFHNMIENNDGSSHTNNGGSTETTVGIVIYSGKVLIECGNAIKNYTVYITNIATGKEIIKLEACSSTTSVDLTGYARGTYKVSVVHNGKTIGTRNVTR